MNAQKIRNFLLRNPKPAKIRVSGESGEPQEIKPGRSFAKTAETISALQPELIECVSSSGELLRAMRTDDEDAQRVDAAAIPEGLKADPNALMLTHFADLLYRATMGSTEIAFGKMVEVFGIVNDRCEGIERRLERSEANNRRLQQEQVEDAFDRAQELVDKASEEGGGEQLLQQMAGAFFQGKLQGNGKPAAAQQNGKGHA